MNPRKLPEKHFSKSYDEKASRYEQRWAKYLSHTHLKLLAKFEASDGDRILDVSAGTGLFAKYICEESKEFSELVLNDISLEMQEVAKKRFKDNPKVIFSSSPAENLPFKSESFDSVICLNAFHHYKHQEKCLSEIYRVLKPGGNCYMLDWNRDGFFKVVNGIIKCFVKEPIHSLSSKEMRIKLLDKQFAILESEVWRFNYWNFFFYNAQKK